MKTSDVSIIICAYTEKRWDDLVDAVASVQAQSYAPHEIIVVIDHNPALLDRVRANLTGVHALENTGERGLSGARNSGIAVATGDILAFMDEDATAAPDWLAQLLTSYDNPSILGVGGAIVPQWDAGRPKWFPTEFDWVVGCTYRGMPTQRAPVRNLIGCNMSLRRAIIDEVGEFRSGIGRVGTLPVGCEETEYCIRARARYPQGEFIYEPSARVFHRVPADRGRWAYFRARCYFEGRSKAAVTQMAGTEAGLASERTYTLRTLPTGLVRGLLDMVSTGDPHGVQRAAAIVAGLLTTTFGYATGQMSQTRAARSQKPQFATGQQATR